MPVLLSLIVIDLQILLLKVTALTVVAYLLRTVALFAVGGLVGWLHKKEYDPIKLFQLGIAAPALITAAVNGGNVSLPEKPVEQHARSSWNIVSQAYAQPADGRDLKQFSLPEETQTQQVYRGLFGTIPPNVWFVIAGSQLTKEAAEKQVDEVRRKGFSADAYAPYGGNPRYAVVIGAQITISEARELQRKAIESGLPEDTYLWTFPQR
jgi:hypothetical protein